MASIKINDLSGPRDLNPQEAAMIVGGPLEVRELTIKATIAPDATAREQ